MTEKCLRQSPRRQGMVDAWSVIRGRRGNGNISSAHHPSHPFQPSGGEPGVAEGAGGLVWPIPLRRLRPDPPVAGLPRGGGGLDKGVVAREIQHMW